MRLNELATACGFGALPTDVEIQDITFDSRAVKAGSLFVALAGARNDGHDYVSGAVAKAPPSAPPSANIVQAAPSTGILPRIRCESSSRTTSS